MHCAINLRWPVLASVLAAWPLAPVPAAEKVTALQLAAELDRIRLPGRPFVADVAIEEFRQGNKERELVLRMHTRRNAAGFDSLFVCLAPPGDRNKLLLAKDDRLWFYDPKSARALPVSPMQFRNHFFIMESLNRALGAGDSVALEPEAVIVDLSDHQFSAQVLVFTSNDNRGAKVRYWLERETHRPIKSEVSSAGGKLLRTVYYSDYKHVLGEKRAMRMVVLNAVEHTVSEIKLSAFVYRDSPDSLFEETFMPRAFTLLQ